MTQGKLCPPEVQQQVLTYFEMRKKVKWISSKTGLGQRTIYQIKKRGAIKYENDYVSPPGRPKKVSRYEKRKIKTFIQKNDRKTLNSTKTALRVYQSKLYHVSSEKLASLVRK